MKFDILGEAEDEVQTVLEHYAAVRPGLEEEFREDLAATLRRITNHPRIHAADQHGCRRANLRNFPYYVAYAVEKNDAWIVAVAHARRRPRYWIKRLKQL